MESKAKSISGEPRDDTADSSCASRDALAVWGGGFQCECVPHRGGRGTHSLGVRPGRTGTHWDEVGSCGVLGGGVGLEEAVKPGVACADLDGDMAFVHEGGEG